MWIPVLWFLLGLVLLIKGGDWFVDGAAGIARRFHIPEILIGATVVSIGTTLPEVMVSAGGAVKGLGSMAYGNAIGSIICNTALICALTIAIRPAPVDRRALRVPAAFFFLSALFYMAVAYSTRQFSRPVGILLLVIFTVYMVLTVRQALRKPESAPPAEEETAEKTAAPLWKDILMLVIGAVLIAFGADLLVDNGTILARALGVPETVVALTFVALGTSLPELVTAITALVKGHSALSLGNIVGANLFNLVLVSGVSTTLAPFRVPEGRTLFGLDSTFIVDLPLMLAVMLILTVPALITGKLKRWQGVLLLVLYAGFCVFQFAG